MKKIKKIILLCLLASTNFVFSQNLIQNWDFETGPIGFSNDISYSATGWTAGCQLQAFSPTGFGTPDVYSNQVIPQDPCAEPYAVPKNVLLPHSGNRYIHMFPQDDLNYGESINGTITQPLSLAHSYQVSCYVARTFNALQMSNPNPDLRLEFVLRKNNDCGPGSPEKVVFTSDLILPTVYYSTSSFCYGYLSTDWYKKQGSFNLDQADINIGYNRLEIRIKGIGTMANEIFIDDVELDTIPLVKAAFNFTNPGQTTVTMNSATGPHEVTQICSTPPKTCITIDGSASTNEDRYFIGIEPWNLNTWQSAGPSIIGEWICTNCTTGTLNLCNMTDIYGVNYQPVFQNNVIYKVTLGVGIPWSSVDHFIIINPTPVISPIPPQTICSGQTATLNVTSDQWPITMHNSITGATTVHFPGPITVTPAATTVYTIASTNKAGCTNTITTKVTVLPAPVTQITGPSEFCMGDSLTFTGSLVSGVSLKHLWIIQKCNSAGVVDNSIDGEHLTNWRYNSQFPFPHSFTFNNSTIVQNPMPAGYLQPGYYRIKLVTLSSETNGCWGETFKVIRIVAKPIVSFQYPGLSKYLCNGESISFYVDAASFPVNVFENGVPIASFVSNPIIVSPTSTTTYTFTPDNNDKFKCSATHKIVVKDCPAPCFEILNVNSQIIVESPNGLTVINEICLPDDVIIDGSCSENDEGYHIRISEFDISSWSFIPQDLINTWISSTGSVPASINLSSLTGNNFVPGVVYAIVLSTGPQWAGGPTSTSAALQFFTVNDNCWIPKSNEGLRSSIDEMINLNIYPNPTTGKVNVVFDKNETGKIEIYSLEGKLVFSEEFNERNQLEANLSDYQDGVYIARISTSKGIVIEKIIKE